MRILLIAYEFPPIVAAQSLRWFYLANGLAKLGDEVHVLCPKMPALPPFDDQLAPNVIIHRVWPGPYVGFSQQAYLFLSSWHRHGPPGAIGGESRWLKIHRWGRRLLDQLVFPDLRSEWIPSASLRLIQLLRTKNYDAVVVSHEPGVDLLLGLLAKRIARLPLIVDLADPVVTPYTPRWRRQLDLALEAKVLACADTTVVTTEAAAKLLLERHALRGLKRKFACIPQGYPDETEASNVQSDPPAKSLHIVYTGNFYADFRSPVELAAALRELRDLDLSICLYGNHTNFLPIFDGIPGLRLFGVASHRTCLSAQKNCDLLLSMGNRQSFQTPGKIYEYLGAGVPILHLSSAATDETAILLAKVRAGLVVHNDANSIAAALREIHTRWTDGTLSAMFSRDEGAIAEFSWRQRSLHYREVIERGIRNAADPCTKSEEEERI